MTNVLLRTARQQQGWNQQQLADFAQLSLSTIERAERGASIRVDSIQRLCACLGKTPEQLGLLHEKQQESESDNMNRRQTLQLLGTGTALLVGVPPTNLPLQEIEHLFTRKMARLQTWIVEGLEDGTRLHWQLYYTSRNTLTEDGLLNQIMKLELLADDGGKDRARICQILAQITSLQAVSHVTNFATMKRNALLGKRSTSLLKRTCPISFLLLLRAMGWSFCAKSGLTKPSSCIDRRAM